MAWAAMWTSRRRPWRFAKARPSQHAAAAPQVGGQAISRVITPGQITGRPARPASLTSLRNSASGLLAAWRLALARMRAKADSGVPYFFMCARPAPPK
jgi:hypothetical protein